VGKDIEFESLQKKYERMVYGLAWRFAKAYGEDVDVLLQEAWLHVWERLADYDQNKGAQMITYIHMHAHSAMWDHCKRVAKYRHRHISDACLAESSSKPSGGYLRKLIDEVSEEAKDLLMTVIHAPEELLHEFAKNTNQKGILKNRNRIKAAVTGYMTSALDWDEDDVDKKWEEIAKKARVCLA
jgi:RNA polymerase sigma factor (sigma-70 family)